jgi:endonuclease YncB( thermonuclease family)
VPQPLDLNHRYLPDCRGFSPAVDFSKGARTPQEQSVIHKQHSNCFGKPLRAAVAPYSSIFVKGMGGWVPVVVAVIVSGAALEVRADEVRAQPTSSPCGIDAMPAGRVARVIDGRSFTLDDGREIRLASIEVPATNNDAGKAAQAALASLVEGETVALRGDADGYDRYGRIIAFASAVAPGPDRPVPSITHVMLAKGHARVASHVDSPACVEELRVQERAARFAKMGLWGRPQYAIIQAGNLAGLVAERGQFALVEGKVLSVRERGHTIYANFGRRWSRALTVTISKRQERMFSGSGLRPKDLENRRVRVRGWIEVRGGPRIQASRPEQIEFVD